jgi:WD40 repeat protein
MLADVKHKEPKSKSGVQLGPGNTITIQRGVGTPTTINVLSFSRDGRTLAAGKDFGRVVVWDVAAKGVACVADTNQGIVRAVALSPDGTVLATGGEGDDFSVKLWTVPDCKTARTLIQLNGYPRTAAFGPKGDWLIIADNAGSTHVFDVKSGDELLTIQDMYAPVLSPDGTTLMTVSKTAFVLWNTTDWKRQRTLPRAPQYAIPLALNPDADEFVIAAGSVFHLLRLSTGEVLSKPQNPPLPKFNATAGGFAAFRANSPLLFGHSDDRVWAWDSDTGRTCASDLMYSESGALNHGGSLLAGAKDNSIFARDRSGDGVWLWDTDQLAAKCGLTPPGSASTK